MTMDTPRLRFCQHCKVWIAVDEANPEACLNCDQPAAWKLSVNDKRFLKSIRVSVNNDHEDDCA